MGEKALPHARKKITQVGIDLFYDAVKYYIRYVHLCEGDTKAKVSHFAPIEVLYGSTIVLP